MKSFTLKSAERGAPIQFELPTKSGGTEVYTFSPGKKADVLMALLVQNTKSGLKELDRTAQLLNWFSNGLNKDHNAKHDSYVKDCQACTIQARLEDDEDDLTIEALIEVIMWLIGESSGGNPTT